MIRDVRTLHTESSSHGDAEAQRIPLRFSRCLRASVAIYYHAGVSDVDAKPQESKPEAELLGYRDPHEDVKPVQPRAVFRMCRWAVYGTLFLGLAVFITFILFGGLVKGGLGWEGYLAMGFADLFMAGLALMSGHMIRQIWREHSRRNG